MSNILFHSDPPDLEKASVLLEMTPQRAGWHLINFRVRALPGKEIWRDSTKDHEVCLVLLRGSCRVRIAGVEEMRLGPRKSVFDSYPHAAYIPNQRDFEVIADDFTELADGRAPSSKNCEPCLIRPEDCGYEIRGGGNATRQIIDILPPEFPADHLLVCEVFTPSGNWSSFPPHKHDVDDPPREVDLEEVYYYRFADPDGFGFQRVYSQGDGRDETVRVSDGDLVLIKDGYHPFVTSYGFDAYYLNFLAGERRSMAASDDPKYARFRTWPPPDPRLPVIPRPGSS